MLKPELSSLNSDPQTLNPRRQEDGADQSATRFWNCCHATAVWASSCSCVRARSASSSRTCAQHSTTLTSEPRAEPSGVIEPTHGKNARECRADLRRLVSGCSLGGVDLVPVARHLVDFRHRHLCAQPGEGPSQPALETCAHDPSTLNLTAAGHATMRCAVTTERANCHRAALKRIAPR